MRLWHLLAVVLLVAIVMTLGRDDVGRVAMVVFCTGLVEVVIGTSALMMLFRTLGAFGHARGPVGYLEAFAATALVLIIATAMMNGVLWVGVWALQQAVTA